MSDNVAGRDQGASHADDPFAVLRAVIHCPADAIRYACILEATAPKPGNVHPAASFRDLNFVDFVQAAGIAASGLTDVALPLGDRIYATIEQTRAATRTNVNLGIVLLIAPLVVARERGVSVSELLRKLPPSQGRRIGQAISLAAPGGLHRDAPKDDPSLDVQGKIDEGFDLLRAMQVAADRDAIAAQYAGGMVDLQTVIAPQLQQCVAGAGDVMTGIVRMHLVLLAQRIDTLILRKVGIGEARRVQSLAGVAMADWPSGLTRFDTELRRDGHRLNPGSTADLIAAALYLNLR